MKAVAKPKAKLQAVAKTVPKVATKPKTKRAVTKDVPKTVPQPSTKADVDNQPSDDIVLEPEEEGCIEGEEAVAFYERSMGLVSNDGYLSVPPRGSAVPKDVANAVMKKPAAASTQTPAVTLKQLGEMAARVDASTKTSAAMLQQLGEHSARVDALERLLAQLFSRVDVLETFSRLEARLQSYQVQP